MKKSTLLLFILCVALIPMSLSSAQWKPLWNGPRKSVEWLGLTGYNAATPAKPTVPAVTLPAADETPRWVGYVKRNHDDWFFRVILSNGKSEMIHRGGATSDGWSLSDFSAQANKPSSITLSRNGVDKILQLTSP